MEIPGDIWVPYIGYVNQTTLEPEGRLTPFKMSRMNLDPESTGVPTDNNAIPGFSTGISAKRKATGKLEQLCFDPSYTIYGYNPYIGAGTLRLFEGLYFRMLVDPARQFTADGWLGGIAGAIGRPLRGSNNDLLNEIPGLGDGCYIFLACRITKIHHMADASAGQPFDFDFESVYAYSMPGEPLAIIERFGFVNAIGNGGFF